jgi:hypothetical protein
MHEELNNFTRNQVWTLEKPPQDARIIGTKWVLRNKQYDQGVIVRNKARLVAKGFSQVEGLDFWRDLLLGLCFVAEGLIERSDPRMKLFV